MGAAAEARTACHTRAPPAPRTAPRRRNPALYVRNTNGDSRDPEFTTHDTSAIWTRDGLLRNGNGVPAERSTREIDDISDRRERRSIWDLTSGSIFRAGTLGLSFLLHCDSVMSPRLSRSMRSHCAVS